MAFKIDQRLGGWLLKRRRRSVWTVMAGVLLLTLLYPGWQLIANLEPSAARLTLRKMSDLHSGDSQTWPRFATLTIAPARASSWSRPPNNVTPPLLSHNGHPGPHGHSSESWLKGHDSQSELEGRNSQDESRRLTVETAARESDKLGQSGGQEMGHFSLTAWRSVQWNRTLRLKEGCVKHALRTRGITAFSTKSIVDEATRFLYCPVEKSASTFFRRFMYALQHRRNLSYVVSPFDVNIDTALGNKFDFVQTQARAGRDTLRTNSTRLLVVREPFSRLFSAYVDKVLVPNSVYWRVWGVPSISRFRRAPSTRALRCGHDVSFEEFIKYVISILHVSEVHVKPVDKLCAPCDLQFSVIAHTETLTWDFQYLLSVLQLRMANFSSDSFMADMSSDAISDSTYSAFGFQRDLKACISLYETCRRLWLKMQLRGIISEDLPFPLSEEQAEQLQAADMAQLLENARKKSQDRERLHQQKASAMEKAYANVSSEDLRKLITIYELDFDLFGYDKHPSFIRPE